MGMRVEQNASIREPFPEVPPPAPDASTVAPTVSPLVQAATNLATGNAATNTGVLPKQQPTSGQPPSFALTPTSPTPDSGGRMPVEEVLPDVGGQAGVGGMGMPPLIQAETTVQTTKGTPMPAAMQQEILQPLEEQKRQSDAIVSELTKIQVEMDNDPTFKEALDGLSEHSKALLQESSDLPATLAAIREMKQKYDQAMNSSIEKVDPNQFWNNKDTGDRILAGIAIFLGGVGAGPQGQNTALKIIDDAIARDINAQQFNIEKARQDAAMWGERIKNEADIQDYIDRKKLESYAKYQMVIDAKLEEYKMRQMPVENKIRINQLQQESRQRLADTKMTLYQMGVDKIVSSTTTKMVPMEQQKKDLVTPWGVAYDQESAKQVRAANKAYIETSETLKDIRNFVKRVGTEAWTSENKGEAKQLISQWINLQTKQLESGVLGETEYARYLGSAPITSEYTNLLQTKKQSIALLNQFAKKADDAAIAVAASYIPAGQAQFPSTLSHLQSLYNKTVGAGQRIEHIGPSLPGGK